MFNYLKEQSELVYYIYHDFSAWSYEVKTSMTIIIHLLSSDAVNQFINVAHQAVYSITSLNVTGTK
jgi:hypothetical protein